MLSIILHYFANVSNVKTGCHEYEPVTYTVYSRAKYKAFCPTNF